MSDRVIPQHFCYDRFSGGLELSGQGSVPVCFVECIKSQEPLLCGRDFEVPGLQAGYFHIIEAAFEVGVDSNGQPDGSHHWKARLSPASLQALKCVTIHGSSEEIKQLGQQIAKEIDKLETE